MLLLFDIDGTLLLKAYPAHRDSLHAAISEVWGVHPEAAARVPAAGRTDGEIAREILLRAGVSAERIDDRMADFREACVREYVQRCPADLSGNVAPGMAELVEELASRVGVVLSLVTGNLEPIARLKLDRAGIGRHFPHGQGAFGSDDEDRAALPPIARWRAGPDGRSWPRERTVVIGDTPRDIACARADGLRCVAIATGPYAAEDLGGADAVARDVRELRSELEGLLESG